MSEQEKPTLPWWEIAEEPGPEDMEIQDPIRAAHYEHLDEVLEEYLSEIRASLMEKIRHQYTTKSGSNPIKEQTYRGLGILTKKEMYELLVGDLTHRAKQIYHDFTHRMMIGQYRVGATVVHLPTRKAYIVAARPNQLEIDDGGNFQYALRSIDTGLTVAVPAKVVESIEYTMCNAGVLVQHPTPPQNYEKKGCCGSDPIDRWVVPGAAPPFVPEPGCPNG